MKKPRIDRFDPKHIKPEEIDLSGVPPIQMHPQPDMSPMPVIKPAKAERTAQKSRIQKPLIEEAITNDSNDAIMSDSKLASMLASYHDSMVETIRKAVKAVGKEVSFVRLTESEKRRLSSIVFSYKSQGIKTSENEINRIAVNFLLENYREEGEQSILARVLAALAR